MGEIIDINEQLFEAKLSKPKMADFLGLPIKHKAVDTLSTLVAAMEMLREGSDAQDAEIERLRSDLEQAESRAQEAEKDKHHRIGNFGFIHSALEDEFGGFYLSAPKSTKLGAVRRLVEGIIKDADAAMTQETREGGDEGDVK